jgi:hypothetical protein
MYEASQISLTSSDVNNLFPRNVFPSVVKTILKVHKHVVKVIHTLTIRNVIVMAGCEREL